MANPYIVTVSIGSNAPDAAHRVGAALDWLKGLLGMCRHTEPYATAAEPPTTADTTYCNAVAMGLSTLDPDTLSATFKEYEQQNGRDHESGYVTIDIDLVAVNGRVLRPEQYRAEYFRSGMEMLLHQ